MRRILDNLPELATSLLMVKFTIFVTGNYRPFIRQCLGNTINLSESALACVMRHRRHVSNSGRATGGISKNRHHHGSRAKSRGRHASGEHKTFTRALKWKNSFRIYHSLILGFYSYQLLKNLLLDYLGHDLTSAAPTSSWARNFRFLDCLLLGRFRFVGRANKISGAITNVFMFAFLLYRSTIHSSVPKFKFYVLEFLMSSHAEVLAQEFKVDAQSGQLLDQQGVITHRPQASTKAALFDRHLGGTGEKRQASATATSTTKTLGINSIYYLRSPFSAHDSKWILRPNRTGPSWLALTLCTKLMIYWSLLAVFVWFALLYRALAGSIFTNKGFEMSYPACVSWLRDMQRTPAVANNYSHIYLAPKVLPHEVRIDDLPARVLFDTSDLPRVNLYNFARIAADIVENHLLYLEFILMFVAQFYLLAMSSIDVVVNALAIKARLASLVDRLETHRRLELEHKMRAFCYPRYIAAHRQFDTTNERQQLRTLRTENLLSLGDQIANFSESHDTSSRHLSLSAAQVDLELDERLRDDQLGRGLADEIDNLQAILADHFDTITRGYNLFVSFVINFLLFIWVSYTLVVCTWMGLVKSRAIEWEFLIAELGGSLFALMLLSCTAVVRAQNVQLHPLIVRAMALDSVSSPSKTRWTLILGYFHPKPFYCFTLFGSTEVSLLLCLKLISWILSAFILLANFYYTNRF